jgi:hypothetical protein
MAFLAASRDQDRPPLDEPPAGAFLSSAERPMDFLVNALNRAVVRKQSAETKET